MQQRPAYAIAIHGGAGTLSRAIMTPEKEAAYRTALDSALLIGETVLKNGGTSLDAVEKTIVFLEDCPLFNAGRGAVFIGGEPRGPSGPLSGFRRLPR